MIYWAAIDTNAVVTFINFGIANHANSLYSEANSISPRKCCRKTA